MMRFQQDIFDNRRLAMPKAESSTSADTWFGVLEERRRLACEIHDTLAQAFAGILLHLESVTETGMAGGQSGSDSVERLARVKHLAKCGLEDSRRMLLGLRPKSLDGSSLVEALKTLAQRCAGEWRIVGKFRFIGQETGLLPNVQDEFYRGSALADGGGGRQRCAAEWIGGRRHAGGV
jgi:signal transduction histidine kinase